MRRIIGLTGLLLCLLLENALAQTVYRLQPGDVLTVWIAQEEDRSWEIAIGPDGWTSFPLVGHVRGQGLSVTELEALFLERIKPYFKDSPNLTIMLRPRAQHQPVIYMTGEVVTPGEYAYRQDMTVLHGVSVAGGYYRAAMPPADQDRAVIVQREIDHSETRLKQLKVLILRLKAELSGQAAIANSEFAPADPLLAEEQKLLDAHMNAIERQDAAQRQAEELGVRNITALSEQIEAVATRLRLARVQLDRITKLIAKAAAGAAMQTVQEGVIAELEGQNSELKSQMVAAERVRISENAAFESVRHERQTQLLLDLQTAQRELQETRARFADSNRIMAIYREAAGANQAMTEEQVTYQILRIADGETKEFDASEISALMPGDLVRVIFHRKAVAEVKRENLDSSTVHSTISRRTNLSGVTQ